MNFYRRYPGDYQRDTADLSLSEHGAYCLLLDHCYATESNLPSEISHLYRICSAMSEEEKAAVRVVVDRFFPLNQDGSRHNKRVDRQLPEELIRKETARNNGAFGGRPRKPDRLFPANPIGSSQLTQGLTSPSPSLKDLSLQKNLIKESSSEISSELKKSALAPEPNGSGITIQCAKNGVEWEVTNEKIAEWSESYPGVDVPETLIEIRQWCRDNPKKRKTPNGMTRFIGAWMARVQNS